MKPDLAGRLISFTVPFEVRPKQGDRSRVASAGGRQFVAHYQPAKVKNNAGALALLMAPHRPDTPLEGPLRLQLTFYFQPPKSMPQKRLALLPLAKDTKPDLDNLAKQVCDVMQATGFYRNDSQISKMTLGKFWSDRPGLQVEIEEEKP